MNEQQVNIAAQMYKCRSVVRRLLGTKYRASMEERANIIRAVAQRDQCSDIVAGATVIKDGGLEGIGALLIMAAVVEMIEPSC